METQFIKRSTELISVKTLSVFLSLLTRYRYTVIENLIAVV